jgi:hypothetical protein
MFKTEGQDVKQGGIGKSLEPGVKLAHIYGATVRTAKSGKKALELTLEGPALPNFEGWAVSKENPEGPKFRGQSSRVMATIYTDQYNSDDVNKNEILNKIIVIANETGRRKQIDALSKDASITSIEQWVERAIDILKNQDVYFFLAGKEEEYNGKTIVKLSLPKFKFCGSEESKLNAFDKNNKYHYSPLETKTVSSFEPAGDDFNI